MSLCWQGERLHTDVAPNERFEQANQHILLDASLELCIRREGSEGIVPDCCMLGVAHLSTLHVLLELTDDGPMET